MEIKFVGTASLRGKCTSYIIDEHILFDCGYGTVRTMRDASWDEKIDTVIISHLHPDHVADIIYFILTCFVKKRPATDLTIIAPTGTRKFIADLNHATFCGDLNDDLDKYFAYFNTMLGNLVELADGQSLTTGWGTIRAFRVIHGMSNSNAYILKIGDKTIGCTGDTSFCPALVDNISQAQIWIIDTTHNKDVGHKRHLSLERLEQLANNHAHARFYAVHGSSYQKETTCNNIFFPTDSESITI